MPKLSPDSLDWALLHAELLGDTDIFPTPFEFYAIRHDWERIRKELSTTDFSNWVVHPHRDCLSPKSIHGFRIATQLDPLDWLVFTALVYEIGTQLEAFRLSVTDEVVFSWRFDPQPDGTMYSRKAGFASFRQKSKELCDATPEGYVVVSDIADFYPRLNHHRLENALNLAASTHPQHIKALMKLLGGWRERQSFGLPVGPSASRLLAEVAIHDIDELMLGEGLTSIRFVDDFRVFCTTRSDAQCALASLADFLWKNHGLTLSEQKTEILTTKEFAEKYLRTERDDELFALYASFEVILTQLGIEDWYAPIEYEDLDPPAKALVDALNLEAMLDDQLSRPEVDVRHTRFILRRLGQLQRAEIAEKILTSIDSLYPVFTEVVSYFKSLKNLSSAERTSFGQRLLDLLDSSVVAHLEYHRMGLLALFAENSGWGHGSRIMGLHSKFSDDITRREVTLALGKARRNAWFRSRKADWQQSSPWVRRAILRGASCLEEEEVRTWYKTIKGRLDSVEKAIVAWSSHLPIHR